MSAHCQTHLLRRRQMLHNTSHKSPQSVHKWFFHLNPNYHSWTHAKRFRLISVSFRRFLRQSHARANNPFEGATHYTRLAASRVSKTSTVPWSSHPHHQSPMRCAALVIETCEIEKRNKTIHYSSGGRGEGLHVDSIRCRFGSGIPCPRRIGVAREIHHNLSTRSDWEHKLRDPLMTF